MSKEQVVKRRRGMPKPLRDSAWIERRREGIARRVAAKQKVSGVDPASVAAKP